MLEAIVDMFCLLVACGAFAFILVFCLGGPRR